MRDYGLEPLIIGENNCVHEWEEHSYYTENTAGSASSEAFSKPGEENSERIKKGRWRSDSFCLKCNAWRGCLGLEPTPDCERPFMELRDDLSEEENKFVISELKKFGLI